MGGGRLGMRTAGIIKAVQLTGNIDKLGWDKLARTDFLSFILSSLSNFSPNIWKVGAVCCYGEQCCTKDLLMMLFVSIEKR